MLEQFIAWAIKNNWQIKTVTTGMAILPKEVTKRYNVPEIYREFLLQIVTCVNPTETKWFLCADDFAPKPENEFRWNEFEIICLDAAEDDAEWIASIQAFWDGHFPFFMSVDGDYEYYAFDLTDGSIVYGCEPEFEEVTLVAKSFDNFLAKIVSGELKL